MNHPTIVLDFDGVLHAYRQGYQGPLPTEEPTPGALEFVRYATGLGYRLVVMSSRAHTPEGVQGIWGWLTTHGFRPYIADVVFAKVPAILYVDDRGYRFTGTWGALQRLLEDAPDLDPGTWCHSHPHDNVPQEMRS